MRKLTAAEKRGLLEVATWIERRGHCYVMRRTYPHHHPLTVGFMVDRLRKVVPEAVLLDTTDKYRYGAQSWPEVRFRTPLTARLRAMLCVAPTTGSDRTRTERHAVQNFRGRGGHHAHKVSYQAGGPALIWGDETLSLRTNRPRPNDPWPG